MVFTLETINYSVRETRQAKFCWIVSSIIINTIDYTRETETRATQNALWTSLIIFHQPYRKDPRIQGEKPQWNFPLLREVEQLQFAITFQLSRTHMCSVDELRTICQNSGFWVAHFCIQVVVAENCANGLAVRKNRAEGSAAKTGRVRKMP